MKKIFLLISLMALAGCASRDPDPIHDSTTPVSKPKPKRLSFGYSEWHLTLYQDGAIVQEYDTITNLCAEIAYTTFTYQGKKYFMRMDYIAEPIK